MARNRTTIGSSLRSTSIEIVVYLILILGAAAALAPLVYMVTTSLKTMTDAFRFPPDWIPRPVVWRNYVDIWSRIPLARMLLNSVKVSGLTVLGTLVSCSLAGYAFARIRFWGRDLLFVAVLATLMVPNQVTLIPTFLLMRKLGLVDTHYPLFVPAWLGPAFGTFLMRQFYKTFPRELEEAAKLDGCNPLRAYVDIFLPLSGPVMATVALFAFLSSWNNLLWPLVFLQSPHLMTFPVGLTLLSGQYFSEVPLLLTAATISIVPTIAIFILLQRFFVQGVVLSGIKG
jgi:ABC-type glycerol-3-phosphate transport system permease component